MEETQKVSGNRAWADVPEYFRRNKLYADRDRTELYNKWAQKPVDAINDRYQQALQRTLMSVNPGEEIDDEFRDKVRSSINNSFQSAKNIHAGMDKPGHPGVTAKKVTSVIPHFALSGRKCYVVNMVEKNSIMNNQLVLNKVDGFYQVYKRKSKKWADKELWKDKAELYKSIRQVKGQVKEESSANK